MCQKLVIQYTARKCVTCLRDGWSLHQGACDKWSLGQCHFGGVQFGIHTPQ